MGCYTQKAKMMAYQKIKTPVLLFSAVASMFMNASAQSTKTIRGTIVDQLFQTPLAGATVSLSTTNQSVLSDANGNFRINNVSVGMHTLHVSYVGYKETITSNIVVDAGKEVVLTILMQENVQTNLEVTILGDSRKNKALNDMSAVSARAFTVEETQKYAAAVNDPSRMATNFAGVLSSDDGNNNIVIRGNSPTGLLWRMEGLDIPNPNHFASTGGSGGGISILSTQLLSNSDFITGAFASEYGNALSGVFDLRLRKGNNQKHEYTLQAGILGLNAAAEGPLMSSYKGSYLVNYRYSTLSLLDKMKLNLTGEGTTTNFQDLSYNIYLPTARMGQFTLFGFGGLSNQNFDPKKDSASWESERDRYGNKFISNTAFHGFTHSISAGSNTTIRSAIGYSYSQLADDAIYLEKSYSFSSAYKDDFRTKKLTVSSTLNHKFNKKNVLRTGGIINFVGFNYLQDSKENPNAPLLEVINNSGRTQYLQAFAQWQYRPSNNLTFNTGFHYIQLFYNNSSSIEPRASVKWDINKTNALAFGYGLHSQLQPLGVYFAQLKDQAGTITNPNKNLGLTKSSHFVLSYSKMVTKNLRVKTELYYQHLFKVPISTDKTNTLSLLNIQSEFITDALANKGKGKNYGLEISLEKYLSNYFYFMWSNSIYQSKYTASDGVERNTRFNGNYVTNMVAGKEFVSADQRRTFGMNIKLVYAGGFRTTPIDFEKSKQEGYTIFREQEAFSLQNPAYFRTDVRISMKWNRKNLTSTLSLDIQNTTNNKNIYNQSFDPLKGTITNNYQAGIIPVLNYKVEF